MDDMKKKFTLIGLGVVLLAAKVIGGGFLIKMYTGHAHEAEQDDSIATTSKAVDSLCQHTDYKQSCHKSLGNASDTNDPKELVKMAFDSAIKEVQIAMDNSTTLKELAKDPRASKALDQCKEVLNTSIDDLKRSLQKLENFDVAKMEEYVNDLKIWLSGSLTYQETCREGFKNTTGEAGEKMKKLLRLG